jgi:GNAT superfamily N-acetyltransferase
MNYIMAFLVKHPLNGSLNMPKYDILHPDSLETKIGEFELSPMPGCPRVGISHGLIIFPEFRGKGLSKRTQGIREELAKQQGYVVLLSTTAVGNTPQEHRQEWNGAKTIATFFNSKTQNDVKLYMRHLYDWRQNL